jgi:ribosomal protein S18 acetylase RimI-like enzyme
MNISIEPAAVSDAEALSRLAAATFALACPPGTPQRDIDSYIDSELQPRHFLDHCSDPSKRVFTARVDGQIAGYLMLSTGEAPVEVKCVRPIELQRIYVLPDYHGAGVAKALMERAEQQARAGNHDALWLGVSRHNPRAISFYEKHGFKVVGEKRFLVGDDVHEDWVMSRPGTS